MYEGETMAQLFKRTKKCCAKIFRKLSFGTTTTTNIPIRIRNQSARYVQQKNRQQSISSPQHSCGSWTFDRNGKIATNTMLPDDVTNASGDEDEYQMFHISPRFFAKGGNSSYLRVDNSRGSKRSITSTPKSQQSNLMSAIWSRSSDRTPSISNNRTSSSTIDRSYGDSNQTQQTPEDDDILFTDNKIYIGLNEHSLNEINKSRTNQNSSLSSIRKRMVTGIGNEGGRTGPVTPDYVKPFNSLDISGNTWSGHKQNEITTTSFIVAQNFIEKFDSCLNLATNNIRNTLTPRIQFGQHRYGTSNEQHQQRSQQQYHYQQQRINNNLRFAGRFDFEKDADESRCNERKWNNGLGLESHTYEEIVFEKVKYDSNKKYLRHTPSSSSASSAASSPKSRYNETIATLDGSQSSYSLDNSFSDSNNHQANVINSRPSSVSNYDSSFQWNGSTNGTGIRNVTKNCCNDYNGNHPLISMTQHELSDRINAFNQNCPTPWDDNGNLYDSTRILYDDPWDVFDNKVNKARDKKVLLLRRDEEEYEYFRTSPRSSSTTLETWVDDEVFDNSFNEELERRSATFER